METKSKEIHFDNKEIIIIFTLIGFVALFTFTLGIMIGKNLQSIEQTAFLKDKSSTISQIDTQNAAVTVANEEHQHKEHQQDIEIEKQSVTALNTTATLETSPKEKIPEISSVKPDVSEASKGIETKPIEQPTVTPIKKAVGTSPKTITVNKIKDITIKHYKETDPNINKVPTESILTNNQSLDLTIEVPTPQPIIESKEPGVHPKTTQPVSAKPIKLAKVDTNQIVKIKPSNLKLPELITEEQREKLKGRYTVQVAAKPDKLSAQKLASELLRKNYPARIVYTQTKPNPFYRVWVGEFPKEKSATLFAKTLKKKKIITEYIVKTW